MQHVSQISGQDSIQDSVQNLNTYINQDSILYNIDEETWNQLPIKQDQCNDFNVEDIKNQLINGNINYISFLTGAGISVSSGIPDFRSQNGIYKLLEGQNNEYSIDTPAQIFDIQYFLNEEQNKLNICYTQNIDGLELAAGINQDKIVQAHGHIRTQKRNAQKI
ncbi:hypothetical protein PPERSA_03674 [Pseudocohnilembus persalinus]|uniref:Deacetylase sirtuin-type domain-containing protein n=1 Tax=Pseudocohnilembus persalinus TaxID=266149 RepID=A0A0V0QNP3_PSEPJ|nr:hypothetical protein PPERSA_03674 [Pseudocohnilembus persalinus]|eukprot:KRX03713.1 hypothetical protein PPERSA_03674 [Pseudocohnilembus persalinus]